MYIFNHCIVGILFARATGKLAFWKIVSAFACFGIKQRVYIGKKISVWKEKGKFPSYDNMMYVLTSFPNGFTCWLMQNRSILVVSPSEVNNSIATNFLETEWMRVSVLNKKIKCLCISLTLEGGFVNLHLRTPKGLLAIGICFLGMSVRVYFPQTKWVSSNVISLWELFLNSYYGNN